MSSRDAARVARHDQAMAAQAEVLDILDDLVRDRVDGRRIDRRTQRVIEELVAGLVASAPDLDRVCAHVRQGAFDWAPRPLVLDVVRGILACWDDCYWSRVPQGRPGARPIETVCFDCGQRLRVRSGRHLLVGYGPILVVAALCPSCRGSSELRAAPGPAGR